MNRIVLGVDRDAHFEAARNLLTRLRPSGATVDLFHVAEIPILYSDMTVPSTMELMADVMEEEKAAGQQLCTQVSQGLDAAGIFARVVPRSAAIPPPS